MADDLTQLQGALLSDRPRRWPKRGETAFRQHKLLAAAVHRATKLAATGNKEGEAWVRYFVEHFPGGRNDPDDARLLWKDWRTALLKQDSPGPGVGVTNGQSHAHWSREDGRLLLNLEDMWTDFSASVESLIAQLREKPDRAAIVLDRWRKSQWTVEQVGVATASFSTTRVVLGPPGDS